MNAYIEPITGRYINLKIEDIPYRIYYEEAGQGVPLLCLHTAGSDGRQYRALLTTRRSPGLFVWLRSICRGTESLLRLRVGSVRNTGSQQKHTRTSS